MKNIFSISSLLLFFGIVLLGGALATAVSFSTQHSKYETVLFLTVVSADDKSSILDKESAANFFAETIVGWFHDPSFRVQILEEAQVSGDFSVVKQERQNLVLTASSGMSSSSVLLANTAVRLLHARISGINEISKTEYSLSLSSPTTSENRPSHFFALLGGLVLGAFFGSVVFGWRRMKIL